MVTLYFLVGQSVLYSVLFPRRQLGSVLREMATTLRAPGHCNRLFSVRWDLSLMDPAPSLGPHPFLGPRPNRAPCCFSGLSHGSTAHIPL